MPKSYPRNKRIADLIMREVAILLRTRSFDPRFESVTIISVDMSHDKKNAVIFFSTIHEKDVLEIEAALNKAAAFFRRDLAGNLELRYMPGLKFQYDASLVKGENLQNLIDKVNRDSEKD